MSSQSRATVIVNYVLCYVVWIALCALSGIAVAQLNGLMLDVSLALRLNQWGARALRQLSLPVLGIAWLIAIFWLEHYLRTSVEKQVLWPRAARATAIMVGVLVLIYLAYLII